MELKYTPKAIYNVEKEAGKPLTDIIQGFEMSNLVILVKAGLNVDEERAFEAIEDFLDANPDNDTIALFMEILERLQKDGFLPRALPISKMKEQMSQTLSQAVEQQPAPQSEDIFGNNGKQESLQQ